MVPAWRRTDSDRSSGQGSVHRPLSVVLGQFPVLGDPSFHHLTNLLGWQSRVRLHPVHANLHAQGIGRLPYAQISFHRALDVGLGHTDHLCPVIGRLLHIGVDVRGSAAHIHNHQVPQAGLIGGAPGEEFPGSQHGSRRGHDHAVQHGGYLIQSLHVNERSRLTSNRLLDST